MTGDKYYRKHFIRIIGGYGSPITYQVFGPKLRNGGRTWIADFNSMESAIKIIDQMAAT